MGKLEIFEDKRTLEEGVKFSIHAFEQSELELSLPQVNNILKTLLVGGVLMSSGQASAESIQITEASNNHIFLSSEYGKDISDGYVKFVDQINNISKITLSKRSLVREILSFKALCHNWDGYGALPLEVESAANSIHLIDLIGENAFCTVREFYPNPHGTITFEWDNTESEIVSVEVGNESFSYFVEMASKEVQYFNNKLINAKEAKELKSFIEAI